MNSSLTRNRVMTLKFRIFSLLHSLRAREKNTLRLYNEGKLKRPATAIALIIIIFTITFLNGKCLHVLHKLH